MSVSKYPASLLILICLSIRLGRIQALNYQSASYNFSSHDIEIITNSLTTPGLAYAVYNDTRHEQGVIQCTLALETISDLDDPDHFRYCNLTANVGEKIYRKKAEALGDDKAVIFVEHPEWVTLLIVDLQNCRFVTSKLYKIYVDFASVRGWNDSFFDILYNDEFGSNHRRWTLDVNGTVVVPPKDNVFKYFKKDKYMYSPTKGLLLYGKPNVSSVMGLYAIDENGSSELLKEYSTPYYHETPSNSLSSYGFLSTCFLYDNGTGACTQYDSNGTFKFEIHLGIVSSLGKVQNLPGGGLLLVVDGCIGIFHYDDNLEECRNTAYLKKIGPDGQDLGQLKIHSRRNCEVYTQLTATRFFQKDNGDICLWLVCGHNRRDRELKLSLGCFKSEDFQSDDLIGAAEKRDE